MTPEDNISLARIFVPSMDCLDEKREIRAALSRQVEVRHRRDGVNDAPPFALATVGVAMAADMGTTLPVILNGLRLLRPTPDVH